MSTPDAIPSRDDAVVVPDYLRRILQQTAERRLRQAWEQPYSPEARDAAIEAVHCIDAFSDDLPAFIDLRVPATVALALISDAIVWKESELEPPHTREAVGHNERLLLTLRELVEWRDRLGGQPPEAEESDDALEVPR
jgi:hypothetical protein